MLLDDIYSQLHAGDPVLEERTVLALARHHEARCSVVTHVDETGGVTDVGITEIDWRWPTHADRVALRHGYCADIPATDAFLAAWPAALVLSDMATLATRPQTRPQALERLRDLLMTWT